MVMLRVDIKLRLDFNQLPLKMQKRSFHVLLTNKTRLNSTMNGVLARKFLPLSIVLGIGEKVSLALLQIKVALLTK